MTVRLRPLLSAFAVLALVAGACPAMAAPEGAPTVITLHLEQGTAVGSRAGAPTP